MGIEIQSDDNEKAYYQEDFSLYYMGESFVSDSKNQFVKISKNVYECTFISPDINLKGCSTVTLTVIDYSNGANININSIILNPK